MFRRLLGIVLVVLSVSPVRAEPLVREGDLIFQTSRSAQSLAVQQATGSVYSHIGMILLQQGKPHVLEASKTVRFTPLADWIAQGEGTRYVLKRLRDADQRLSPAAVRKLHAAATLLIGKSYDLVFAWSDQQMYCSELVWKIYDRALGIRVGTLQKVRDFSLTSLEVQARMRERYGNAVPLDETVISPVAMFDSPLLVNVYSSP